MRDLYQTDFDGYLREDGCLLFSIIHAATQITGKRMPRQLATTMIDGLHAYIKAKYDHRVPAISDENDQSKPGAFIWDHEQVFNQSLLMLGSKLKATYAGRKYMTWEEKKGHESFGSRTGDIIIMQIKTIHGNGHFRMLDYDPWEPGTKMVDLKSLRYYWVG
jgi:hypothetical protein